jgi:hypothetical protein
MESKDSQLTMGFLKKKQTQLIVGRMNCWWEFGINLQFRFGFEEKRLDKLDEAVVTDDARVTGFPDFVQLF